MSDRDQTTGWRPISDAPPQPMGVLVYYAAETWRGLDDQPYSFGAIRDHAERFEIAFYEDGQWFRAGSAHELFDPSPEPEHRPTH